MVSVRKEKSQDIHAITQINSEAFVSKAEADLVEDLRQNEKITLSLVALVNEQPVGHLLFTQMKIISATDDAFEVIGLGPLAVLPEYQRQGIGSTLCQEGISMCRDAGHQAILVLGHPTYYSRFGFQPAVQYDITSSYDVPVDAFMALELQEGALERVTGIAHYQPEFDGV